MWKSAQVSTVGYFCSVRLAGKAALFPPPVFCAVWAVSKVSSIPMRSHCRVACLVSRRMEDKSVSPNQFVKASRVVR